MNNYRSAIDIYTNARGESIMFGYITSCNVSIVKLEYNRYSVCEIMSDKEYFDSCMCIDELKFYLQQNKVYNEKDFNQFTKLSLIDFNTKYASIIEPGFYGLAINDDEVIDYLDRKFQSMLKYEPDFTISQIKTKFSSVVIYADGLDEENILELREGITAILNK